MKKTSVYLSDDEDAALRRAAEATGIARSDLIREGIRAVVLSHASPRRTFRSMGRGRSGATKPRRWTSDELFARRRGGSR
jgi:Arc/MetJ-type ribon-helix-helix transcriptional regulator